VQSVYKIHGHKSTKQLNGVMDRRVQSLNCLFTDEALELEQVQGKEQEGFSFLWRKDPNP